MAQKFIQRHVQRLCHASLTALFLCSSFLFPASSAYSQESNTKSWSLEEVQQKIDILEKSDSASAAENEKLSTLRLIAERLRDTSSVRSQAATLRVKTKAIPARVSFLKRALEEPLPSSQSQGLPEDQEQLEQLLAETESQLKTLQDQSETLSRELSSSGPSEKRTIQEIAQKEQSIDDLNQRVAELDGDRTSLPYQSLVSELGQTKARLELLESELKFLQARQELIPLERDFTERKTAGLFEELSLIRNALDSAVSRRAAQHQKNLERLLSQLTPLTPKQKKLSDEVGQLSEQLLGEQGLLEDLQRTRTELSDVRRSLAQLTQDFTELRRRYRIVGASTGMGRLLSSFLEGLPSPQRLSNEATERKEQLIQAQLEQFQLEERREKLPHVARVPRAFLNSQSTSSPQYGVILSLIKLRESLLQELLLEYPQYSSSLLELVEAKRQLAELVQRARSYSRSRVLWVPIVEESLLPSLAHSTSALTWMLSPEGWKDSILHAIHTGSRSYVLLFLSLSFFVISVLLRTRMRKIEKQIGTNVHRYRTDSIALSLRQILIHSMRALRIPFLFFAFGTFLVGDGSLQAVGPDFGMALQQSSLYLFFLLLLLEICREGGLCALHFRWSDEMRAVIRRNVQWFIPLGLCFSVLLLVLEQREHTVWYDSLGRNVLAVGLVIFSFFLWSIFRSSGAIAARIANSSSGGILVTTSSYWRSLVFVLPLVFAGLSFFGYHYVAIEFHRAFHLSLWLAVSLLIVSELLHRWLYIARRRAIVQRKQAERNALAQKETAEGGEGSVELASFDEDKVSIPNINHKTQTLFRSGITVTFLLGIVFAWADLLPATEVFSRVQLYPQLQIVAEEEAPRSSPPSSISQERTDTTEKEEASFSPTDPRLALLNQASPEEVSVSPSQSSTSAVTLLDLITAFLILSVVWISVRNVPALIEIMLLEQLRLDAGARYAANAVIRYSVTLLGATLALSVLGIGWSNVQWLAAALTFGLAFGLQEIFANFISGIIVLFEQPIRVGDTVTIGNTTGLVTKIRMRATTICDWDRKELVIPNKEFVTGHIINWSLSDSTLRIIVPVGVAYGSDTKLVERTLHEIANKHPRILKDPSPRVIFRSFGESSLDFELRCFIPSVEDVFSAASELHFQIDHAFRERGIEISFPQRDLHLRSSDIQLVGNS